MKRLRTPGPPPKCPRPTVQSLPRRPGRVRLKKSEGPFKRRHVCPPMQMLPPSIMLSLLAEAPTPMDLFRVDREKCAAPKVPRVFLPTAPLGHIELPRSDGFGPTSPLPLVGRSDGEDGGIPRRVKRTTATVVPPLLLTPACIERAAKAVWTCVDPAPALEPPQQIVVRATLPPSATELTNGAFTDIPCGEVFPGMLAAVDDPPGMCKGCGEQAIARPVRKRALPIFTVSHGETESTSEGYGKDDLMGHTSVLAIGDAPRLELTTRIQEVIRDLPQSLSLWCAPPLAAPYVPAVLEPMFVLRVKKGVAARESERPRLIAGADEAAKKALDALDNEFPGSTGFIPAVEPPESIKREPVLQPSVPPDQNVLRLKDVPVWRDAPSDANDNADVPPPSPGPMWRDSEDPSRELNARDTRDRLLPLPETEILRTPAWASSGVSRRSQSPLGTMLRRKRGKPKASAAGACGGKGDTSARRKKRSAGGQAIWKDSPAAPRLFVDPARLLDLMPSSEAAPRNTIETRAFSGSALVAGGVGAASPLPPPPNEKTPMTNRDWGRITHPLRARSKDDEGLPQGRPTACLEALRPVVRVAESLPACAALTRTRGSSSGFPSVASASSAASFWRSIASIPDGTPNGGPSPPLFSSGTRLGSQAPPAPPRAPAFEPQGGGSDHHPTRPSRRSRQHRVRQLPGEDARSRHGRGGKMRQQLHEAHCRRGDSGRAGRSRQRSNRRGGGRDGELKRTMPVDVTCKRGVVVGGKVELQGDAPTERLTYVCRSS